jgi:hypothetical protein
MKRFGPPTWAFPLAKKTGDYYSYFLSLKWREPRFASDTSNTEVNMVSGGELNPHEG